MIDVQIGRLNHVDPMVAGQELRGLVQTGLVEQHGAARWTSYTLKAEAEIPMPGPVQTDEIKILDYVREHGSINNLECRLLLGVGGKRAWYLLQKLRSSGTLESRGEGRWRRYMLSP